MSFDPHSPPMLLRILPPAGQAEALLDAEARILGALAARYPHYDFAVAQSPRPPGAELAVVPASGSDFVPEAELEAIRAAILSLLH